MEKVDKEAVERRERIKKAVAEKFAELAKAPDAPLGLAYAVDGKIRKIRTFAHSKIWDMYVDMLLNTVAMEGDQAQRKALAANKEVFSKPAEPQQAVELVKNAEQLKDEVQGFVGNDNSYRKSAKVWSGKCLTKAGTDEKAAAPVSQSFQPAE